MIILQVLFWLAFAGIVITYIAYPALMLLLPAKNKPLELPDELPTIAILFAAFNEETVLKPKLDSLLRLDYPKDKLQIWVGSDNSTDKTNGILKQYADKHTQIHFKIFKSRTGKSGILNALKKDITTDYLVLTDANIMFESHTVKTMLAAATAHQAQACGGHIIYTQVQQQGIAQQENTYLNLENRLKKSESDYFGLAMGLEGGCYLIKRELFPDIPPLFFMEDFFVTMHLLKSGHKVVFEPNARVYEDVSTQAQEEYKRKIRISIGNFQNLKAFGSLIFTKPFPLGFAFLCHKVLRWLSPFFLIILFFLSPYLVLTAPFYGIFAGLFYIILALGILGIAINSRPGLKWLKFPGHFLYMNLALLQGFLKYIQGVRSNAWQPTKRNQS